VAPRPLHFMYGELYIGGLPPTYVIGTGGPLTRESFSGCIGDAVLDKTLINFVNATDKYGDILQNCAVKLKASPNSNLIGLFLWIFCYE
jgi:hypothetical protein